MSWAASGFSWEGLRCGAILGISTYKPFRIRIRHSGYSQREATALEAVVWEATVWEATVAQLPIST